VGQREGVKLVSAIPFGSAIRGWRMPEDLDVLIVVDEPERRVGELCRDFSKVDLRLSEKYTLYPDPTIMRKD